MRKTQITVSYIILTVAAILVCFPILFSICLSFSDLNDILKGDYIPSKLDFTNYINAFNTQPLLRYMINSAITGVLSTTLQITFALLAAYAIVFIPFRGKKIIFLIMMATMMIPGEVLVISNFQTIRSWNLLNTFPGLILPGVASTFGIFLFRQNMMQIPLELKEASTVAGISDFGFFVRVVAPMVKNTVVTLAIYFFLVSWNSYLWPLLSTTEDTVRTVPDRSAPTEKHRGRQRLRHDGRRRDANLAAHTAVNLLRSKTSARRHDQRSIKIKQCLHKNL